MNKNCNIILEYGPNPPQIDGVFLLIMLLALTLVYFPILCYIWRHRFKNVVYFKSPYMILIGGIGLYLDSVINLMIMHLQNSDRDPDNLKMITILSIIATCSMHYISYFSIIFRAQRIFQVTRLLKERLDGMQLLSTQTRKLMIGQKALKSASNNTIDFD
mmetsp:Transcript_1993/g.3511  ORF Transcript_1993/g.3511 Transcript_1993/m.3511 type:complete len:160 (+) Transcript_1993:3-482(+)